MGKLIALIFIAGFMPLAASAQEVTFLENQILQLESQTDEQSIQAVLELTNTLYEMSKNDSTAAQEIRDFAKTNPKIISSLCKLANHPMAKANESLTYTLAVSVRRDTLDAFLTELVRPELNTEGVLNLLAVFKGWVIRDPEMIEKIRTVIDKIRERYVSDGYVWRYRLGTRRYSDVEEKAVIAMIDQVRSKTFKK